MSQLSKVKNISKVRKDNSNQGIRLTKEEALELALDSARIESMGIGAPAISSDDLAKLGYAQDSLIPNVTETSVGVPAQFLQTFLTGAVYNLTTVKKADALAPIMTVGSWSDAEIVQTGVEFRGNAGIYKDHGDVPLVSTNVDYLARDVIRFELGLQISKLEQERGQAQGVDPSQMKREALTRTFEILRNDIFFNGYAKEGLRIYGFLNDPNLPAIVDVAAGAVSTKKKWSEKTAKEITDDIVSATAMLQIQSGGNVDAGSDPLTLAIPNGWARYLTTCESGSTFGLTARKWLSDNYPNMTIVEVPQLTKLSGNDAGFYLYAESVADSGTDDQATMLQLVPARLQALNSMTTMRGYEEGYTNALAGCLVKRPYAVVRYKGI